MNEMYGKTFESFLKHNNIDRNQYDVIIGPEYVRGGNQLCLVHKDGKPTPLVDKVRGTFKVVTSVPNGPSQPPIVPNKGMTKMPDLSGMPKGMGGRIMRNQNVAAAIGTALAGAIQWIGDKGIQMRIEDDLQTKYKAGIEAILKRGEGVLVIIHMKEWLIPDFNGMRGRMYLGISLSGGSSQENAMANWKAVPRLLQGPGSGWRCYDNYAWIPPSL